MSGSNGKKGGEQKEEEQGEKEPAATTTTGRKIDNTTPGSGKSIISSSSSNSNISSSSSGGSGSSSSGSHPNKSSGTSMVIPASIPTRNGDVSTLEMPVGGDMSTLDGSAVVNHVIHSTTRFLRAEHLDPTKCVTDYFDLVAPSVDKLLALQHETKFIATMVKCIVRAKCTDVTYADLMKQDLIPESCKFDKTNQYQQNSAKFWEWAVRWKMAGLFAPMLNLGVHIKTLLKLPGNISGPLLCPLELFSRLFSHASNSHVRAIAHLW